MTTDLPTIIEGTQQPMAIGKFKVQFDKLAQIKRL